MNPLFRTDVDRHRRTTGAAEDRHAPSPPTARTSRSAPHFPTHPLRESPRPARALSLPAESPAQRLRVSPPGSNPLESHPILCNALPRYGQGESWDRLLRDFPGIPHYLTPFGLSAHTAAAVVVQLDDQGVRHLRRQVQSRIDRLYSGKDRELAMECLDDALSDAHRQERIDRFQRRKAAEEQDNEVVFNREREFFRKFIGDFLGIIDRFESGEPMFSLKNALPNIGSYIKNDGFARNANELIKHLTPGESERLARSFEKRKAATAQKPRPGKKPAAPVRLNGVLRVLQSDPRGLLDISRRFGDSTPSIGDGVCDQYVTPPILGRIVNTHTGELTPTGELVIANADARTQAAIRANFRLRFQNAPAQPRASADGGQDRTPSTDSFFSGLTEDKRRMGYLPEPATPQYPPQPQAVPRLFGSTGGVQDAAPTDSFFSDLTEDKRRMGYLPEPATPQYPPQPQAVPRLFGSTSGVQDAPPTDSFFSDLTEDKRRMGYLPEPATPQYPARSYSSTFADLSSLNGGAWSGYGDVPPRSPAEVTQPWHGDDPLGPEPSTGQWTPRTGSPERIDVDALPDLPEPGTPHVRELNLSAGDWLNDEHMSAYTEALARRLAGRPHAGLLNFANPLHVGLLYMRDVEDRQRGRRYITHGNDASLVFMPINNPAPPAHWSLLVIDQRAGEAFHYDSLVHPGAAAGAVDTAQYRRASIAAWEMGIHAPVRGMPIARQRDGNSCGDHVLQAIDVLAHRVIDGTLTRENMDLSDIAPDRGLIADILANASARPAADSTSAASPTDGRPAKKSRVREF